MPLLPVAYLMADLADGCLQIKQVTVHPGSARRGLGRAVDHAGNRAAADGLPALTLTTFAHVPWNAPLLRAVRFRVLGDAEFTPRGCGRSGTGKLPWAWTGGREYACAAISEATARRQDGSVNADLEEWVECSPWRESASRGPIQPGLDRD
jgi:hypothetical protein